MSSSAAYARQYLISVRVERSPRQNVDLRGLASVDFTAFLAQFDLKRDQLRSGYFKEFAPHNTHGDGSGNANGRFVP